MVRLRETPALATLDHPLSDFGVGFHSACNSQVLVALV